MKKVLIIEDDIDLSNLLKIHLRDLSCDISIAHNGKEGFDLAYAGEFDLILLDIMLPDMDGLQICQKLRALDDFTPILMLTAKSEEIDKVIGLESGADDYITKPFKVREFVARVKAILRRQERYIKLINSTPNTIEYDQLSIDLQMKKVMLNDKRLDLTPKEFDLLVLMAKSPGRSYSRAELLEFVWGYDFSGYEHTVNAHINRLRAKIEEDPNNPKYIMTNWGVGYRFNDEL